MCSRSIRVALHCTRIAVTRTILHLLLHSGAGPKPQSDDSNVTIADLTRCCIPHRSKAPPRPSRISSCVRAMQPPRASRPNCRGRQSHYRGLGVRRLSGNILRRSRRPPSLRCYRCVLHWGGRQNRPVAISHARLWLNRRKPTQGTQLSSEDVH